jgi:hypothetical protein
LREVSSEILQCAQIVCGRAMFAHEWMFMWKQRQANEDAPSPRPGCAMSVWGWPESLLACPPHGAGRSTGMAYSRLTKRQWRGCLDGMRVYTHYYRHKRAHLDPGRE